MAFDELCPALIQHDSGWTDGSWDYGFEIRDVRLGDFREATQLQCTKTSLVSNVDQASQKVPKRHSRHTVSLILERDKRFSNSSDIFEPEKVVGALHATIPVVTLRGKIF